MAIVVNEKEKESEKEIQHEQVGVTAQPFSLFQFLREVRTEYIRITWPSREQIAREFFSVLFLVFLITGIIFLLDKVFEVVAAFFTGRLFY